MHFQARWVATAVDSCIVPLIPSTFPLFPWMCRRGVHTEVHTVSQLLVVRLRLRITCFGMLRYGFLMSNVHSTRALPQQPSP